MMARLTMTLVALATVAACAAEPKRTGTDEAVMIQKGVYTYNPNKRHAPVSLSGADLVGIEIR